MDKPAESVTLLAYEAEPIVSLREGEVPHWLDYQSVVADLADDGVAAPEPFVEGLQTVVREASDRGLDLKVVYTEAPAAVYTDARDVAMFLNDEFGGTILVRTPAFIGSSSDTIPRHQLEAGQDDAWEEPDPVTSASIFVQKVTAPAPQWGVLTATAMVVAILVVVAFAVVLRRRTRG
ncbi:DUF6676 family protein [Dietzia sp. ANT_WB102]|uniref:Rv1476 family membrane protein n=1 Tax=Dietzia sp. ANT_WB102 TaxID=2597345 RepID=UPI0011EEC1D3|nr:DUF6676 family protein [Dietzia sp. ANT_WB102]KAA0919696.1 hypothetical protein FQ137_10940 [Dietzia sp. ANT_WB102]